MTDPNADPNVPNVPPAPPAPSYGTGAPAYSATKPSYGAPAAQQTFSGTIFSDAAVAITPQSPYNAVKDPMTGRHV